LRKEK
jgi:serum/glucocorticoid-regulated kinase 2